MQLSLYIRSLMMVGLVLSGVTVSFVAMDSYQDQKHLTGELETRLDRLVKLLAVSVAGSVWELDSKRAGDILSSLKQYPDFHSASIVTEPDKVFVQVGESVRDGSPVVTAQTEIRLAEPDAMEAIGQLTVSLSQSRLLAKQQASLVHSIILGAVQLAAVLLVTALVLHRLIGPLESITSRLIGLAQGRLKEDIPGIERQDQIGNMAKAIWTLRESLTEISDLRKKERAQAKELLDSRDLLEKRVADRTRELRETSQFLQDVGETTYDRFWETDKEFRFTSFRESPGSQGFVNIPDLIGLTRWEGAGGDPDKDEKWHSHREDLRNLRRVRDFEYSINDLAGKLRFYRISGKPVFDDAGDFTGYRGSATDITQRKLAEIEQRRNEALITAIFEYSQVAISIKDLDGDYLYVSPKFAEHVGYSASEMIGMNFRKVYNTAQIKVIAEADQRVVDMREPLLPEDFFSFSMGEMSLLVSKFPILDDDGNVTGIGTAGLDITEQIKARDALSRANDDLELKVQERTVELEKARDLAETANELKSQLITTMSHELRTPLTSIMGTLRMLSKGVVKDVPEAAVNMIEVAWRNSEQLANLVNDILDVEKLSGGALTLTLEPLEVSDLVEMAIELNLAYAQEHGVDLVTREIVPDLIVEGDKDRLLQVMANLLSNASKFSLPGGKVETSVTCDGKTALVSVTDHGTGIPDHLRDQIFDKFVRGDTVDNRNRGGAGLGLGIAKAIIEQHGGRLYFDTETDRGTTMSFELNCAPVREAVCS